MNGRSPRLVDIDVALVPAQAGRWNDRVCIVIDELRASSTITTLLDLGCSALFVTRSLAEARALRREHGALLAGERGGVTPRGFDANNSPSELSRLPVSGRPAILCTSNGTRVLDLLRDAPATLVGCLLNAGSCAEAAVRLASEADLGIGIVCAGVLGQFALDDAVAAGVIVAAIADAVERRGGAAEMSDSSVAAVRLHAAYPDTLSALRESVSGRVVSEIGYGEDVTLCAQVDVTATVGILRPGQPLRVERLERSGD